MPRQFPSDTRHAPPIVAFCHTSAGSSYGARASSSKLIEGLGFGLGFIVRMFDWDVTLPV